MIYYHIVIWGVELINQIVAFNNYDISQHLSIIYFQQIIISLFLRII
jgi:hypothetical protein